ncbi:MAG: MBL fold metallo-hydrolase [Chloroflexi bacterium]|nr:MBL fold metallo-hydrolase [Chloroflexota bacterium]MBP8054969.1 MBL fold metallo-hydrolase [Chloroflexota bacterium]
MNAILPPSIRFLQRGWHNANHVLLLDGEGPVLVDTGGDEDGAVLLAMMKDEGVDAAALSLIVNTHSHWDHSGGNRTLKTFSGAPLAASALSAAWFAHQERRLTWLDYFAVPFEFVPADIIWQDGDVVQLGEFPWQVIAIPGHAPDAIALYQPEHKLLISADALHLNDCGIINVAVHGWEALDAAATTTHRLQQLDIALALPGHGPLITDAAASLERIATLLAQFRADPEKLYRHLVRRVFIATVLARQPVSRSALLKWMLALPWTTDYLPTSGYPDAAAQLHDLLSTFIRQGVIVEEDGLLICTVRK